jgi:hypothetical protein
LKVEDSDGESSESSASEVLDNVMILEKFSKKDAAVIGYLTAEDYYRKVNKIKRG